MDPHLLFQEGSSSSDFHPVFLEGLPDFLGEQQGLFPIPMDADGIRLHRVTWPFSTMDSTWAMEASSSVIMAPGWVRGVREPSS